MWLAACQCIWDRKWVQIYNGKMHAAHLTTINLHALQLTSALQVAYRISSYYLQQVLMVSQAHSLRLTGGLKLFSACSAVHH